MPATSQTPYRVVITNVFSDDNRGGAAITGATIVAVRDAFPDAEVALLAIGVDVSQFGSSHRHTLRRYPECELLPAPIDIRPEPLSGARAFLRSLITLALPRRGKRQPSLARLARANLIVSKGGHIFIERGSLRGVLSLWLTAWPLIYGWSRRIPTVVFCSTVGPFTSRMSRWVNGFVLRRVSMILTRDSLSFDEALRLGINKDRLACVPDSVFSTQPPSDEAITAAAARAGLRGVNFGVVTCRSVGRGEADERFRRVLADAIRSLLDSEDVERICVALQVDGDVASDRVPSSKLVELAGDERVQLLDEDLPPDELISLYGAARFVVGSRLHSTIFALVAGTPVISVAVRGAKAQGVYRSLGMEESIVHHRDLDAEDLAERLRKIVSARGTISSEVAGTVARERERTERFVQLLREAAHRDS